MPKKVCNVCKEAKPLAEYHRRKKSPDGLSYTCKECAKARARANYEARREEILKRLRQNYAENADEIKAKTNAYYWKNREQCRERASQYREKNAEECRERNRRHYAENKEQYIARRDTRRHKEKKLNNTLTRRQWELIKEFFNHRCAYCGRENIQLEREHVVPVSQGGGLTVDNIVPACRKCNNRKGDRTPEEAGMEIKRWE